MATSRFYTTAPRATNNKAATTTGKTFSSASRPAAKTSSTLNTIPTSRCCGQ